MPTTRAAMVGRRVCPGLSSSGRHTPRRPVPPPPAKTWPGAQARLHNTGATLRLPFGERRRELWRARQVARRHPVLASEHRAEMRRAVEAVVEGDRGDRTAVALGDLVVGRAAGGGSRSIPMPTSRSPRTADAGSAATCRWRRRSARARGRGPRCAPRSTAGPTAGGPSSPSPRLPACRLPTTAA